MAPGAVLPPSPHFPVRIHPRPASMPQPHNTSPTPRSSSIMSYINAVQFSNVSVAGGSKTPAAVRHDCITHLLYSSSRISSDGHVTVGDSYLDERKIVDGEQGCIRACTRLRKHNRVLKVLLSIGSSSLDAPAFSRAASDPSRRFNFVNSVAALVDAYKLDGIDISWESIQNPADAANFILLLHDLRRILPQGRLLLTASLYFNRHIDIRNAAMYLDLINIKCFDFASPDWSDTVHHASQTYQSSLPGNAPANCFDVLDDLTKRGAPVQKILLGIPAFGRGYTGACRLGQPYSRSHDPSTTYKYCELPQVGRFEMDDEAKAVYCSGGDGGLISYDNPWSIQNKADLVRENKIAGIIIWEALGDSPDHRKSIVYAAYNNLLPAGVR